MELCQYTLNVLPVVVIFVALRPRQTAMVMSERSVNLTTLFLGRLRPSKRLTSIKCAGFRQ